MRISDTITLAVLLQEEFSAGRINTKGIKAKDTSIQISNTDNEKTTRPKIIKAIRAYYGTIPGCKGDDVAAGESISFTGRDGYETVSVNYDKKNREIMVAILYASNQL